jgi:RimJ/RimL family protein N-acetyltransferase
MSTAQSSTYRPREAADRATPTNQNEHVVHFYRDDAALVRELADYVVSALARGASAIIIATAGHREQLTLALENQCFHVGRLRAAGRYVALDASQTLENFLVDGRIDRGRFFGTVGPVVAQAKDAAPAQGSRVAAFGEMVGLLWAEGKPEAAVDLERLWNELATIHGFDLRCAYPMPGFCREELAESLLKVCAEHTGILSVGSEGSQGNYHTHAGERARGIRLAEPIAGHRLPQVASKKRSSAEIWNNADMEPRHFPQMILTERLGLRRYRFEDVPVIVELLSHNREKLLREFPQVAGLQNDQGARGLVEEKLDHWTAGKNFCFGIWRNSDDALIGQIQVKNIAWEIPSAELSYFIDLCHQRQGYASESIRAILRCGFQELAFERIFVRILPSNQESLALARKLGFREEGLHRKAFRCGLGELHDICYMAITADEYR